MLNRPSRFFKNFLLFGLLGVYTNSPATVKNSSQTPQKLSNIWQKLTANGVSIEHLGRNTVIEYTLSGAGQDNLKALTNFANWPQVFPMIKRMVPTGIGENQFYFKINHLHMRLAFVAKIIFPQEGGIRLVDFKPFNATANPNLNLIPEQVTLTWDKNLRCNANIQWNLNLLSSNAHWWSEKQTNQLRDAVGFLSSMINRNY